MVCGWGLFAGVATMEGVLTGLCNIELRRLCALCRCERCCGRGRCQARELFAGARVIGVAGVADVAGVASFVDGRARDAEVKL